MVKRAAAFGLTLPPRHPGTSAYRWLYASLRSEILEGRLQSGARLPATRDLARQHQLSRGTIVSAFELLKSEGYLRGSVGSGTYVSRILPEALLQIPRKPGPRASMQRKKRPSVSNYARRLKLFPAVVWAQTAARRLRHASMYLLLGCDPMGYQPLRDAVADYLSSSRG